MRILFVCLGNICRSPAAEGVLRARAADRGLDLDVDSAGTGDWHVGDPPHPPMVRAAHARGVDLSPLRGRQVGPDDFARFDLILAMDGDNLANLRAMRPDTGARLGLLTDHHPDPHVTAVPDPYYDGSFDRALDLIETAVDGLLDAIEAQRLQ